jgi:hypothetical protein
MPRKPFKHHFIYKTTCILNEQYYVGMHSTSNLDDGYLGSGKKLKRSIKKYGEENFKREILEFFESRDLLKKREAELIDDDLLNDPKCMNLQHGGGGGFSSEEHRKKCTAAGLNSQWHNQDYIDKHKRKFADNVKKWRLQGKFDNVNHAGFKGSHHTNEARIAIGSANKIKQSGSRNSQYGSRWITNGIQISKIKKDEEIPIGWYFGKKLKI